MEENKVIVFIKTNEYNNILEINSSVFLKNTDGWISIDEGIGDKYTHAQRGYFDKPIYNNDGIQRYKLIDAKPVEQKSEEIEMDRPETTSPSPTTKQLATEIAAIKEQIDSIFDILTTLAHNI